MNKRFYFTTHPGDYVRGRLIKGSHIMMVASAHWDNRRKRFKVDRPPADYVSSIAIDSGGFNAAKKWGEYPWTVEQYVEFIHKTSENVKLDFCAILDYACEPSVNREIMSSNIERIDRTIENDMTCREQDNSLPWLSVMQGDSYTERGYDIEQRRGLGVLPEDYVGIGSVCKRKPSLAKEIIKFYADRLPGVAQHAFGIDIRALDDDDVWRAIGSWDSYSWAFGAGMYKVGNPGMRREPDEDRGTHGLRLAKAYWEKTVLPRMNKERE
jgi:hypothetical protein